MNWILVLLLGVNGAQAATPKRALQESDGDLIQQALELPAEKIFKPQASSKAPKIPLVGSLKNYLTAIAQANKVGKLEVSPELRECLIINKHRCAHFKVDPCPKNLNLGTCEGLPLNVLVDTRTRKLDAAWGPGRGKIVNNQADIELYLSEAP